MFYNLLFYSMETIQHYHEELHQKNLQTIREKKWETNNQVSLKEYSFFGLIDTLQDDIVAVLQKEWIEVQKEEIMFKKIDRKQHWADIALSSTALMKLWWGKFQKEIAPKLVEHIELIAQKNWSPFLSAKQVWMYINITLRDNFLLEWLQEIQTLWNDFWSTNTHNWEIAIAEYSSPNAAKHLHAGHIRSTVIGQIIANMYKEVWYEVHTLNHVNDRWWFGEIIEWYARWKSILEKDYQWNDLSFAIYSIYRTAEKLYNNIKLWKNISHEDKQALELFFDCNDENVFLASYEQYKSSSQETFRKLEWWDENAFLVRKEIYANSMQEFNHFYNKLWVEHDYTIGESFYEKMWKEIVQEWIEKWIIVHFTQEQADVYFAEYVQAQPNTDEKVIENKRQEIYDDVGSFVALLDNFERYVVQRSDGASIYATRDLGCIAYRCKHWDPSVIMYEVGQEQADHFQKLFETARKFWRDVMGNGGKREFLHISHGFYVNKQNKKKLSSREWASNVTNLIASSESYFKNKYHSETSQFSEPEIDHIAQVLGKTSIIINDIRKWRMAPVLVDTNIQSTLEEFEKAGWAYLMYTLCRAKSVMAKSKIEWNNSIASEKWLEILQADLIKLMLQYPNIIKRAVEQHEPSIIVDFVYELTSAYNTLYNDKSQWKIIENSTNQAITQWYVTILENAFRVFHIEPLERM